MINASGAIFISLKSKRLLLNLRSKNTSSPLTWGCFGGKVEQDETILKGLSREIKEEIGFIPTYKKVLPLDIFTSIDKTFHYYTFAVLVEKEFTPRINNESGGYGWFNLDSLPKPLHSGAKAVLMQENFNKNFEQMVKDYS